MPGLFRRPPQPTQLPGRSARFRSRYYSLILSHGPVGWWRVGEASGTVAVDETGNSHANYQNTPTLGVAGAISGGGDPDTAITLTSASNEWIQVPDVAAQRVGNEFTLEAWIKTTTTSQTLLFYGRVVGGYSFQIAATTGLLSIEKDSAGAIASSTVAVNDGAWHHIAWSRPGTASGDKIYIDGVDRTGTVTDRPNIANTGASGIAIGSSQVAGGHYLNGSIDEPAIYDYALSAAQVLEHYTIGSGVGPSVSASAGHAAGTGAANQAPLDIAPNGGHASATGAAHGIAGAIVTNGGVASATGAAGGPAPSLAVNAGHGAATGAAFDATVTTANITNVDAGHAAATGAAQAPSVSIVVNAGHAAGTGAAGNPNVSTTDEAPADTASATGVANQPAASISSNGGASAGTGAVGAPSPSLATNTSTGSATGAAHDATVTVTGAAQAAAGHAAAAGSAFDASVDTGAIVIPSPPHGAALVVGPAQRRIPRIRVKAGVARATARAYDATTDWNDDETVMALLLEVA